MAMKQIVVNIFQFLTVFIVLLLVYGTYIDYVDHYHFYKQCKTLHLGEELSYDKEAEHKVHEKIIDVTKRYLGKEFNGTYQQRTTTGKRFEVPTHATVHGCMNAKLNIHNENYTYGIFQHKKQYDVVLKFTEESEVLWKWKPKMLALSMKVYGINGTRIVEKKSSVSASTQDFVFQAAYGSYNNPEDYIEMFTDKVENENINARWNWFRKHPFLMFSTELAKWRGTWNTPFTEDLYNTIVAYKWKNKAAKFHLKPCASNSYHDIDYDKNVQHDVLRQLAHHEICFTLYVQEQRDPCHHPIDVLSRMWITAPLIPIGEIIIPQGSVLYDYDRCLKFHFNICNGLQDHQPLGKIARARCATYNNISEFRISQNVHQEKIFDVMNGPRKMCIN